MTATVNVPMNNAEIDTRGLGDRDEALVGLLPSFEKEATERPLEIAVVGAISLAVIWVALFSFEFFLKRKFLKKQKESSLNHHGSQPTLSLETRWSFLESRLRTILQSEISKEDFLGLDQKTWVAMLDLWKDLLQGTLEGKEVFSSLGPTDFQEYESRHSSSSSSSSSLNPEHLLVWRDLERSVFGYPYGSTEQQREIVGRFLELGPPLAKEIVTGRRSSP